MFIIRRACLLILCLLVCPFGTGQAAHADALSIEAQLWRDGDKGDITLSQDHMKAGPVEFVVTNTSTDPVNEWENARVFDYSLVRGP
jgi:hypothetical protein